jgi:hypothetical protein
MPQVIGFTQIEKPDNIYLKNLYEEASKMRNPIIHRYTFRMEFPYDNFRSKLAQVDDLCQKYREIFGARPWYDVIGFGARIIVKFTILTLDSKTIMDDQPKFAKDLYKIIFKHLKK